MIALAIWGNPESLLVCAEAYRLFYCRGIEGMNDARKDAVLALTEQVLREADNEFKGLAVHKVGEMYDSVDIFRGVGKINVRIAGDSPLAIFKDIARAIPC